MDRYNYLRYHNVKVAGVKNLLKKILYGIGRVIFFYKKRSISYRNFENVKRILFISLYFRGDVLFHTPVIRLLKNLFPGTKVDVWVKPRSAEVLHNNQDINEVFLFDSIKTADYSEDHLKLDIKGKWNFLQKLRKQNYDLIVDYTGLYSTSLFTLFASPKYSVGKNQQGFGFIYNNSIDIDLSNTRGNLIDKYIDMLGELLRIDAKTWESFRDIRMPKPIVYIPRNVTYEIDNEIKTRGIDLSYPFICIHLTAGWEAKRWSILGFTKLIRILYEKQYEVAIVGNEYDREEYNTIIHELSPVINERKLKEAFFSLPLQHNAELIKKSDVFIGSDSAPLHIAGAVGTPSVALFGPTNPDFSNPVGENHLVLYYSLYCSSPSSKQYCTRNAGKNCPTVDCMKAINHKQVLSSIEYLLKKTSHKAISYT